MTKERLTVLLQNAFDYLAYEGDDALFLLTGSGATREELAELGYDVEQLMLDANLTEEDFEEEE